MHARRSILPELHVCASTTAIYGEILIAQALDRKWAMHVCTYVGTSHFHPPRITCARFYVHYFVICILHKQAARKHIHTHTHTYVRWKGRKGIFVLVKKRLESFARQDTRKPKLSTLRSLQCCMAWRMCTYNVRMHTRIVHQEAKGTHPKKEVHVYTV